ncbi:hypothetical protein HAX54_018373, partial [Datura stramonium]|nr:hypothetical protein [Datura stramonium]
TATYRGCPKFLGPVLISLTREKCDIAALSSHRLKIKAEGPSPAYQTRSIARQPLLLLGPDEGDNSLENGSSSGMARALTRRKKVAMRPQARRQENPNHSQGDVLKDKTLGFRDKR